MAFIPTRPTSLFPALQPIQTSLARKRFLIIRRKPSIRCTLDQNLVQPLPNSERPPPIQRYFDTFTWRGLKINYRVEGPSAGFPVLFIHGFGASINHWRKNIPALVDTSRLRVYAIDLLGFGGSAKPSPSIVKYGIPLWKDLVRDFTIAMEKGKKWALVGNSVGSLTALMAACEMGKERVRALALINCAGGLVSFRYTELNRMQAALLRLFNTVLFNRYTGPSLFANFRRRNNVRDVLKQVYVDQSAITEELLDILCAPSMDEGACAVFLAILNADAGPTPEELLLQLQWCPTLVVWGGKDPWTPLRRGFHPGIKFGEYHEELRLEVIENAGHCVHDECPDAVNSLLVPFLLEPVLYKREKEKEEEHKGEEGGAGQLSLI